MKPRRLGNARLEGRVRGLRGKGVGAAYRAMDYVHRADFDCGSTCTAKV
ncbi:MAG: hypothetical protein JWR51_519 [Devosia sp.]|nr:hypothetical protein [Devosia sp.]